MGKTAWVTGVFVLSLLILASPSVGQIITGEITGAVTDQAGAAVPGASVTATCIATNIARTVITTDTGSYRITNLPVCLHKITVTAQGFKTEVRQANVEAGIVLKADFRLQVGQKTETVTVEAAAPLVDYSPGVNNEVDTKSIVDLPTEGRDFKSILALTPGVQRSPGGGFLDVSISGQRTTTNNYLLDGMPNNDRFYGSEAVGQPGILGIPSAVIGNDSIAEFSVQQLPTAEYGVKGGAAVNVVLKSGTNDLHGSAFYFGDYDWLNAKNVFSSVTTPYHNHNYGGTVGGPIIKDRTFFFASFEGQENRSVVPYTDAIPTEGDLAQALNLISNANVNPAGPNHLSVNPAGLALLQFYPCSDGAGGIKSCAPGATLAGAMGVANAAVPVGGFTQTQFPINTDALSSFLIKIDHKLNSKMQLSGRYLFADSLQSGPLGGYTIPPAPGSSLPIDAFNTVAPTRVQLAGGSWTYTISPNKILETHFNWSRYSQILDPNNKVNPLSLGLDTGPLNPKDFGVPPVYASSVTAGNIGGIFGYPLSTRPTQSYDFSTHFSWTKGSHAFKFGGSFDDASTFSLRNRARSSINSFQGAPPANSGLPSDWTTVLTQLLLGRIDEADRSFGDTTRHIYQRSLGFFFQDEWKVKPRLTISYGLRWEVNGALGEGADIASNFYPCAAPEPNLCPPNNFTPGLLRVGSPDNPRLYGRDFRDFGPRAGLAWDVFGNGKTALRIGYSMLYDVANFAAISAPYAFHGARAGALTNSDLGVFSVTADGRFSTGPTAEANNCYLNTSTCPAGTLGTLFEPFGPNTCYNPLVTSTPDWVCFGAQSGSGVAGSCLGAAVGCFPIYGTDPTGTPPFNIFGTVSPLRTPRIQYYSMTIQHELFRDNVLTISYIGSHGTDMFLDRNLNLRPVGCWNSAFTNPVTGTSQLTGPPNSATNTSGINCSRPFDSLFLQNGSPAFLNVVQLTNDGFSRYNAMQVTYRQRNWHGVNSIVNFTWSNCIDSNSVNRGGAATLPIGLNPYVPGSNEGPCDTDVRLNFNTGVTYDFPKWKALGRFGEGWQIGGIYTGLTGRPWTPLQSQSTDNSGQDRSYQRPDCVGPIHYDFGKPSGIVINGTEGTTGSPVAAPADGTIGTCGRNSFRGPRFNQLDLNINKITKITERVSIQLRWEIFNALNHPNYNSTPTGFFGTVASSSSFGSIGATPDVFTGNPFLSQGGPRAMQLGAKIIF
jgi:hypothetical protein